MAGKPAAQGQWIPMVNPETQMVEEVRGDTARAALDKGWTVETSEQRQLRQYQQEKGGSIVEGAKAAGEHALSSATLGLSDVALAQDPEYREQRKLRDATFKAAGVAGEAAGFLVPGLGEVNGLGIVGRASKAIGAPVSAAGKVAAKVGTTVERVAAGAAPGAARRVASKALGGAAGGAIEGGIIGAGQALSDASIQNKELTAQLLLDHVRNGATIGGLLGGGLSAGIESLSLAGSKVAGAKLPPISEVLGGAKGPDGLAQTKALTSFGALGSDIKRIVKEGGADAPNRIGQRILDEAGYSGEGAIGRAIRHDINSAVEVANERVAHYTDRLRDVYRKLDEGGQRVEISTVLGDIDQRVLGPLRSSKYGGDKTIARSIESDLDPLISAAKKADDFRVSSDLVGGFRSSVNELDQALRTGSAASRGLLSSVEADAKVMRKHFESLGQKEAVRELDGVLGNVQHVMRAIERSAAPGGRRFTSLPGVQKGLDARLVNAQKAMDRLAAKTEAAAAREGRATLSYQELWDLRKRIDKDITNWTATASPNVGAYRDLREVLKDQIERQASRTGLAKEFADANSGVADWIKVQKIAKERSGSLAGNRSIGLTDTIMGAAGVAAGGLGGGAAAVALAAGNKFIRSPAGDRTLATLANRYSQWRKVVQASDDAAARLVSKSRGTVRAAPLREHAIGLSSRLALQYNKARERLAQAQNPERLLSELSGSTSGLREVSPELADATVQAGARSAAFVSSLMPQAPGFPDLKSIARKRDMDVAESDKDRFLRSLMAADSPSSILAKAHDGKLTPSDVVAAKEAAPELYDAMRASVVEEATQQAGRGRVPGYQQRLQLSILTGIPLDASARPEVIAAYQALGSEPEQQMGGHGVLPTGTGKATKFGERRRALTDSIEV